jgi:polyhydroxyalkanoate synthesis regulator protein
MEAEYAETKEKLEADLASLRADAQQAREQLLADAKQRADRDRADARQAVDEASRQRIKILEQLMGVYRDLESVPAALDSAYQDQDNPVKETVNAG